MRFRAEKIAFFIFCGMQPAFGQASASHFLNEYMSCSRDYGDQSILSKMGQCEVKLRNKFCSRFYALPENVQNLLDRQAECNYWAGEFSGTRSERDKEINQKIEKIGCGDVANQTLSLTKQYRNKSETLHALLFLLMTTPPLSINANSWDYDAFLE